MSLELTVHHTLTHARDKILLPTSGRILLAILLQVEVYHAAVSMIDKSTALVDMSVDQSSKDICVYDTTNNTWSRVNVDSASGREITPDQCKIAV